MIDTAIRNALIDSYNNYAIGVDTKNWPLVRSCFTDQVSLDYGELSDSTGGSNVLRSSDDWVAILQGAINGFDITRHAITNHRVTVNGDSAVCIIYLNVDHIIYADSGINIITTPDSIKPVGDYTNEYRLIDGCWKIVKSQLQPD